MRVMLAIVLMLCCSVAFAGRTYRFDKGVVAVGDNIAQLVERAGKPDRTVPLENGFGAGVGERWEYYLRDGKMVSFYISGGHIYNIDDGTDR
jgi:hypothetical protein